MGAYQTLAEAGLRVPEDMSIVGYDDQEDLAAELRPPLTTLRLPYYEMGRWALEQIFAGTVPTLPPCTYVPRCQARFGHAASRISASISRRTVTSL